MLLQHSTNGKFRSLSSLVRRSLNISKPTEFRKEHVLEGEQLRLMISVPRSKIANRATAQKTMGWILIPGLPVCWDLKQELKDLLDVSSKHISNY